MRTSDALAERLFLVLQRRFDAPRERVFQAFTDPEVIKQWWGPQGFTTTDAEMDPVSGGRARWCMVRDADGHVSRVAAQVVAVEPPCRLVLQMTDHCDGDPDWQDIPADMTTIVTLDFEALGRHKTEVTLRQEGFPDALARDVHKKGWASGLDCLGAFLVPA